MAPYALAAEHASAADQTKLQKQFQSRDRTYYREHRLRAYQRSRAGMQQGATCVTPKGVCWIVEPLSHGNSCTCESRRFGTIAGVVGG